MQKIFSSTNKEMLLHVIIQDHGESGTTGLVPAEHPLQALIHNKLPLGKEFAAHAHLPKKREIASTQEGFVVTQGKLQIAMYDIDHTLLHTATLKAGDSYIYLAGGHAFKVLEENTSFYEFKNGPYLGVQDDKIFISDKIQSPKDLS